MKRRLVRWAALVLAAAWGGQIGYSIASVHIHVVYALISAGLMIVTAWWAGEFIADRDSKNEGQKK